MLRCVVLHSFRAGQTVPLVGIMIFILCFPFRAARLRFFFVVVVVDVAGPLRAFVTGCV